jgi:hypothetical protein
MAKAKKPPGVWIGPYQVHPYPVGIPEMGADDLAFLTQRTAESGPLYPVTQDAKGFILDGRAQLRACLAGKEPTWFTTPRTDAAWVVIGSMRRTEYGGAVRALTIPTLHRR